MDRIVKQAFTLIELLVVIAIIGILSGLIVVSMGGMTTKANIAKSQVFSNSLRNSLMLNTIGEWKLDEGSSTTTSDTWGKNGTVNLSGFADTTAGYGDTHTSGWVSASNCISKNCLKFDGTDDYIDCGSGLEMDLVNAFTLSLWINPSIITAGSRTIFYRGSASGVAGGYAINQEANKINGYLYDTAWRGTTTSTTNLTVGQWYYAVVTYDKTNLKLYINGVNEQTSPRTTNVTVTASSTTRIGDASGIQRFNGSIDEIRMYNSAMPISQVKEQYYIGLHNLFATGQINKEEYQNRLVGVK